MHDEDGSGMKLISKIGIAGLVATAAVSGSALTASAAPTSVQLSKSGGVTVPLKFSPGTHTVAFRTQTAATPDLSGPNTYVDIRVGKNDCGGYKGNVYYGADIMGMTAITATGTLWDNCNYYTPNTTVYLYISWNDNDGHHDGPYVASVTGAKNTENIGEQGVEPDGDFWNVYADLCLKWDNGWGCGPSQLVVSG